MNDFTKEELLWIYGKMPAYIWDRECPIMFSSVINKLKSLIDNYCEHVWTDGSGNIIYCTKCNFILGKR
jgi:hypothetical protein